jgi:hypothetical protein
MNRELRELLTDAVRFWEVRRLLYNGVLAGLAVFAHFLLPPSERHPVTWGSLILLVLLALIANVAYCAAYVPELLLQLTAYRDGWRRWRWIVFAVGLALAGLLTLVCVAPIWFR